SCAYWSLLSAGRSLSGWAAADGGRCDGYSHWTTRPSAFRRPPVHHGFRPAEPACSRSGIPALKGSPTGPGRSRLLIGDGSERWFPRLQLGAITLYKLSTMASSPCIRLARIEEAAALSDLCIRSKAVWGYDEVFMALARIVLEVRPEQVAAGDVWVATGADGEVAGMVALA